MTKKVVKKAKVVNKTNKVAKKPAKIAKTHKAKQKEIVKSVKQDAKKLDRLKALLIELKDSYGFAYVIVPKDLNQSVITGVFPNTDEGISCDRLVAGCEYLKLTVIRDFV